MVSAVSRSRWSLDHSVTTVCDQRIYGRYGTPQEVVDGVNRDLADYEMCLAVQHGNQGDGVGQVRAIACKNSPTE